MSAVSTDRPSNPRGGNISLPSAAPPRPLWGRWQLWLAVLVVLGFGALVLTRVAPAASPHQTTQRLQPVTINPLESQLQCPRDIAWSPDGREMAVLGYADQCPTGYQYASTALVGFADPLFNTGELMHSPGLLNLYDARQGRLLAQIHPDDVILSQVTVSPAMAAWLADTHTDARHFLGVNYGHVLWSPDGQHLAVAFSLSVLTQAPHYAPPGSNPPSQVLDGIVLYDTAGHNPRVAMRQVDQNAPATTVWDVGGSEPDALVGQPAKGPSPFAGLPPALGYAWSSDGALLPQTPLPSSLPAALPSLTEVGSLSGAQVLSLWQPGVVFGKLSAPLGAKPDLAAPWIAADATAWSPDGRYLAERVAIAGLLAAADVPIPDPPILASYGWGQAPVIPIRDRGLRQAMALATDHSIAGYGEPGVLVAWRPDGKLLAVTAGTPDHAIMIFDCATGRQVASLPPPGGVSQEPLLENQPNVLRWSPDGKQLAVFDTELAQITIWSGSLLPH